MPLARLTAAHAEPYRALMLHAYHHDPLAFTATVAERAPLPLDFWARRLAPPDGLAAALGAFHDSALVGTVRVEFSPRPRTAHRAVLTGLYVHPVARRQGLARQLVHAALDLCRDRGGIRSVVLTYTEGNLPAQALYLAAGFHPFGTEPHAILSDAGPLGKVHMQRPL